MSLEDKAKEYVNKQSWNDVPDSQNGEFAIGDIRNFEREAFTEGYKQALKDMIDRAEELQLPYLRMYKKIAEGLEGK